MITTMNSFDYYKYGNRLIRVNEEAKHFRDITPNNPYHLTPEKLKSEFPNGFSFIRSLDFSQDNDEFMKMYNSFKLSGTDQNHSNGNRVDDDKRELILKYLEADTSIRKIASITGVSKSTIQRMKLAA